MAFISSVLALPAASILKMEVLRFIFLSPETIISALFTYISFHAGIALHELGHFVKAVRLNALNERVLNEAQAQLQQPLFHRMWYLLRQFLLAPYGRARGIKREGLNYYPDAPYNLAVAAAGPETSRNVAMALIPPACALLAVGLVLPFSAAIYAGRLLLGVGVVAFLDFLLADPGKYREFRRRERQAHERAARVAGATGWFDMAPGVKQKMLSGRMQEVTHQRLGPVAAPWQFRNCGMGGRHTEKEYPESNISMQEAMFLILGARDYQEAQEMTIRLQNRLKEIIEKAEGGRVMGIGLEGGLAPYIDKGSYPLPEVRLWAMMKQAMEECGYRPGVDVAIALDPAMSELEIAYRDEFNMPDAVGMYLFWRDKANIVLDREEVLDVYISAIRKYDIPIVSIEDGFSENDVEGWRKLLDALGDRIFVIGDDLVTTNDRTIEISAEGGLINTALIKANQIGTLYETLLAMIVALGKGLELVISHRSKSPNDDMEAHIAVATNALGLKAGGGANTERLIKYQSVAELLGNVSSGEGLYSLSEDQKAVIHRFYSYEEPTNAGIPTVGTTAQFLLPDSGVLLRFRGATPLGTSAGTGEALHLVDSLIEAAEHREVINSHRELFREVEPGVYAFQKTVDDIAIQRLEDEALETLFVQSQRYQGKGCLNAVNNVLETLAHAFEGRDAAAMSLRDIDGVLLDLELRVAKRRGKLSSEAAPDECVTVMQRKQNLGMNALLSVSLALARGVAHIRGKELYELLREEMLAVIHRLTREYRVEIVGSRFSDYVAALRVVNKMLERDGRRLHEVLRQITGIYVSDLVKPAPPPPEVTQISRPVPEQALLLLEDLTPRLEPAFLTNEHHGLSHAEALLRQAAVLADMLDVSERIDWRILSAAICLHDLAYEEEQHGRESAAKATELLGGLGTFSEEEISRVEAAIHLHEDRTAQGAKERHEAGLEAEILYDVDQLDAFGVKGIYRYVAVFTERGTPLEAIRRDAEARYNSLTFDATRQLAKDEYEYAEAFFNKYVQESLTEATSVGAGGVVALLREYLAESPGVAAEKALTRLEAEPESPDADYAKAYFRALQSACSAEEPLMEAVRPSATEAAIRPRLLLSSAGDRSLGAVEDDVIAVSRLLYDAFAIESYEITKKQAVRRYLEAKTAIAQRIGRFGIVNNRIFIKDNRLIVPYLAAGTLVIHGVHNGRIETLAIQDYPMGTIWTDDFLAELSGVRGIPIDLERQLFGFDVDQAEDIRISRLRDMGALLQRVNEATNRNEAVYVLRFLVARLCSLSFRAFVGAKNLQPEVRNLIDQLVSFLNTPFARRVPLLVRLLVRNISALVVRPSIIDRLWDDTIDLAEIHVPGSGIVNELRRSTHHALGKRTLVLAQAYLEYVETGDTTRLARLGYPSPAPADEEARSRKPPRKIMNRVVEDLETLLGTTEVVARIREWQSEYQNALYRCDFGRSMHDEVDEITSKGIREKNKWVYSHHLRILKKKGEDFARPLEGRDRFLEQVEAFLRLKPDDPDFNPVETERCLRESVAAFSSAIQAEFQAEIFPTLESILSSYQQNHFSDTVIAIRTLRRTIASLIGRDGFTEQRYFMYQVDCLLEEMGYLSLSHISTRYEEEGVDIRDCLEIIQMSIMNLAFDGKFSRELIDLGGMLTDRRRTYAEVANLLESIQRNYHRVIQRVTVPYEKMQERLNFDDEELRAVLGNMKRYMHDLNSMVHFSDLARAYILDHIVDRSAMVYGAPLEEQPDSDAQEIIHLSHKERIAEWVKNTEMKPNLRERFGGKGAGLVYISYLSVPTRDGFILPTTIPKWGMHERDPAWVERQILDHLHILEEDISTRDGSLRRFGDAESPLLVAVRGGSVFSMPGILSTVVFVGINDTIAQGLAQDDPWHAYDSYRRFLASFAWAVWGVDIEAFDLVEETKRRYGVKYKKDLPWQGMKEVTETSKAILRKKGYGDKLDTILVEPKRQILDAVQAVFASWSKETPKRYRDLKGICHTWHTAVTIQEMASGNRKNIEVRPGMDERRASLTGVLPHTELTDRGVRTFAGEIKFSAAGDDLVGGVTRSSSFQKIGELETLMPMLNRRLRHTVAKIRRFQGTDQEIEFTVERGVLSILQARSAEITADQEAIAFVDAGNAATRGIGIRGGGFRGLVAFDEDDLEELLQQDLTGRDDVDGVLMLIENPTPDDIPLILQAGGLLTVKGGSSSHAAVAINGIDNKSYSAVMSAAGLRVNARKHQAVILDDQGKEGQRIRKGDIVSLHGTTGEVYIGSRKLRIER